MPKAKKTVTRTAKQQREINTKAAATRAANKKTAAKTKLHKVYGVAKEGKTLSLDGSERIGNTELPDLLSQDRVNASIVAALKDPTALAALLDALDDRKTKTVRPSEALSVVNSAAYVDTIAPRQPALNAFAKGISENSAFLSDAHIRLVTILNRINGYSVPTPNVPKDEFKDAISGLDALIQHNADLVRAIHAALNEFDSII